MVTISEKISQKNLANQKYGIPDKSGRFSSRVKNMLCQSTACVKSWNYNRTNLLLHGVDGYVQGRIVPLHLLLLVNLHDLCAAVGSPDPDYPQDDHEEQETHTHHDDGSHAEIWNKTNAFSQWPTILFSNSRNPIHNTQNKSRAYFVVWRHITEK